MSTFTYSQNYPRHEHAIESFFIISKPFILRRHLYIFVEKKRRLLELFPINPGRRNIIRCCLRSSSTSLWVQENIESKLFTFWTQIRTAEIHLNSNCNNFCIRTLKRVNLFLLESLSRALSSKIGLTSKFLPSEKLWPKQSDPVAETGPEVQEKGAAPPLIGPIGLVRIRV